MGTWQKTLPCASTRMIDFPAIAQGNWDHLEDYIGVEHYGPESALSGQHKPGCVSTVFIGPTADIASLSDPTTGALAFDTDVGTYKWHSGSEWMQPSEHWNYSAVAAYPAASGVLTKSAVSTAALDSEVFDKLSEWNATTYTFIPCATGFYMITATFQMQFTANISLSAQVWVENSVGVNQVIINHSEMTKTEDPYPVNIFTVVYLVAGYVLSFRLCNNDDANGVLHGGATGGNPTKTYVYIYRLS